MGNCNSRKSTKQKERVHTRPRQSQLDMVGENEGGSSMSAKSYDDFEVAKLKRELFEKPELFVLNNLLMSIMFFENFEREKTQFIYSSLTTRQKELDNTSPLCNETIERVLPDMIFEKVNKNVKFRRIHGPNKNKVEPLVPQRMYVVNDNIDVIESQNTPQYIAIDKPSYQVVMENRKNHIGYVQLKVTPSQPREIARPDESEAETKAFDEPKPGPSWAENPEEIYDYSTIQSVNTPKPLEIITSNGRRDTLPKSCFSLRKIKKYDDKPDDSDEEYDEPETKNQTEEELFETINYVSSKGFMQHFQNSSFPNHVGRALGFDMREIKLAKAIPGKVFCNLQDPEGLLPCEIIPSVSIQWPIEQTFEFHDRTERPIMWDKFGNEYRWPKVNMVNDIRSLTCALVPRGYIPKRGENPNCDLEWEVCFPKAQRYLDTHMSHTQTRAFLFLLTIYKSFIEPTTKRFDGVLVDHIRTHMYWECETNPRDWPEHRLGSKLAIVIKNLIDKLSSNNMPDFFMKRKNTFLNVPNKHLAHAQKVFHDVLESPAIYFIGALRNLKYTNNKFYPKFDFKELYRILTSSATQLINPRILDVPPNMIPKNRRPKVEGDTNYIKEIKWQMIKERQNREKILRKQREQKMKEENLKIERRGSVDSIDYEMEFEKKFDTLKIRPLLSFFIHHFIEMAKRSRTLATQKQALFFLKQATYLARIMEETGLQADAVELQEIITREEDKSKKLSVSEAFDHPPSTPKRNSTQFNYDVTQQVKGNNINLSNLNRAYNNTMPNNINKIKRQPSNLKRRSTNYPDDKRKSGEFRRSMVGFSDTIELRE